MHADAFLVVALDIQSGEVLWQTRLGRWGGNYGYWANPSEHDVV